MGVRGALSAIRSEYVVLGGTRSAKVIDDQDGDVALLQMARAILRSGQTTGKSAAGRFLHERAYAGTDDSGRSKVYGLLRAGLPAEENGRLIAGPSLPGPPAVL